MVYEDEHLKIAFCFFRTDSLLNYNNLLSCFMVKF